MNISDNLRKFIDIEDEWSKSDKTDSQLRASVRVAAEKLTAEELKYLNTRYNDECQ